MYQRCIYAYFLPFFLRFGPIDVNKYLNNNVLPKVLNFFYGKQIFVSYLGDQTPVLQWDVYISEQTKYIRIDSCIWKHLGGKNSWSKGFLGFPPPPYIRVFFSLQYCTLLLHVHLVSVQNINHNKTPILQIWAYIFQENCKFSIFENWFWWWLMHASWLEVCTAFKMIKIARFCPAVIAIDKFIILSNINCIVFIMWHLLQYIYYNAFVTLHSLHCIHYIAFITLYALYCRHYTAFI